MDDSTGVDPRERTVLVHLSVLVPAVVGSSADEVADAIMGAIEVGSDDPSMAGLHVTVTLAEEV